MMRALARKNTTEKKHIVNVECLNKKVVDSKAGRKRA